MHRVCPFMLSSLLETLSYGIPFVKNVDPTGQFLNDSERVPCQVIAVIEDLPQNSHFNFEYLFPAPESGWIPKVLTYSGFYNIGVKEIWDMVYEYIDFVKKNGYFDYRRNEQSKYWMYETINEQLRDSFYHNPRIEAMLQEKEQQVLQGNLTSFIAAKSLLDTYFDELKR